MTIYTNIAKPVSPLSTVQPITLTATDDTFYGTVFNPGPNGTSISLAFGGFGDSYFDFIKFDLSSIPSGVTITSAIFNIYVDFVSVNDPQCVIRRVTSTWDSSTLTRTNAPTVDATSWGSVPSLTSLGVKSVDITNLVKSWYNGTFSNFGIQIFPQVTSNNNNGTFYAIESGYVPYIQLTYTATQYTPVSKDLVNFPQYGVAVYGVSKYGRGNPYTGVSKPVGTSYTNIAKPT